MIVSKPPEPTENIKKIKTRGFWRVKIHPVEFDKERIKDVSELSKLVEKASVSLRGWDFPHIDHREPPTLQGDWIRSEVNWDGIVESWLFFQSGLFIYLGGIREDWRDQSSFNPPADKWEVGKAINAHDAIFSFVEIYEFAARMAGSIPGSDRISISIELIGLKDRHIYMSLQSRRMFRWERHKSDSPDFHWIEEIERPSLMAQPRELSAKAMTELAKRFKWDQPERAIKEIQDELRQG